MKKKYLYIILALYLILILKLIVFKYPPGVTFNFSGANFVPFKTILMYLAGEPTWNVAMRNLLGNIVVFIPLGLVIAALYNKMKWRRALFVSLLIGVMLESLQVIFRSGIMDIDDVILNSLGVFVGYLLLKLVYEVFGKRKKD